MVATRLLIQLGLIERIGLPGDRRDYFHIRPNIWIEVVMRDIDGFFEQDLPALLERWHTYKKGAADDVSSNHEHNGER